MYDIASCHGPIGEHFRKRRKRLPSAYQTPPLDLGMTLKTKSRKPSLDLQQFRALTRSNLHWVPPDFIQDAVRDRAESG